MSGRGLGIVGLNYVSFYFEDLDGAVAFYTEVLGEPDEVVEEPVIFGWKMGSTWLTFFPSRIGTHDGSNPRNGEFAIQVDTSDQVDALYQRFLDAGATECSAPEDTEMYDPMRFSCVDDPFGVRVDIYCPIR